MASAIPQQQLAEIVREARARTGVPAVAAGLLVGERVELAADGPVEVETPFRIASITKWFTASLAALLLDLDAPLENGASARRLLSHTADLRPSSQSIAPRGVPRALVVLERRLRARRRGVRGGGGLVLLGRGAASCCSTLSGSSRRASRNRRTRPAGTSRRERRVSGPHPRSCIRSRGARPAGSGRPSATCFGSRRTSSAARGRCPLRSLRRCTSREPQPSAPATASAVGAERSPAAVPRSTTRDRWAATSRFS